MRVFIRVLSSLMTWVCWWHATNTEPSGIGVLMKRRSDEPHIAVATFWPCGWATGVKLPWAERHGKCQKNLGFGEYQHREKLCHLRIHFLLARDRFGATCLGVYPGHSSIRFSSGALSVTGGVNPFFGESKAGCEPSFY